ncbi:MAG: transposase [Candidatus Staskawiczbacteria bacterium]|nr:transposase [Candidatus Staskawiczbacteria bacterium]
MPIRKFKFIPGGFYHLFNRGNGKQDIFRNDKDRYRFLQAIYLSNSKGIGFTVADLEKIKGGYSLEKIKNLLEQKNIIYDPLVKICTDCLMPNHFHFLVEEIQEGGVSCFMQKLGNSYARYFSIKYDRPGSLFQGRFGAVEVSNDNQLKYLLIYINVLNPAQLVESDLKENGISDFEKVLDRVENYSWSGHQEFMGRRNSVIIDKGLLGEIFSSPEEYFDFTKNILEGKQAFNWKTIEGLTLE